MSFSREERVRMERAHVLAWPALSAAVIDGWLWRCSGGGSQRANSVSTIDYSGSNLDAAVTEVETRYRSRGAPARFQTYNETAPVMLAEVLSARGYREGESTVTMFKRIENASAVAGIEERDHPWPEWLSCYLDAITENRRVVNRQILSEIPARHAFFGYRRGTQIVSTALCVVGFGCAVIECVATRANARRQGSALITLSALETWAARQNISLIGLQVVAANEPAVALYRRLGFEAGATNQFWVKYFE